MAPRSAETTTTLYTSGLDGAILSWDLDGRRRFAPLLAVADFEALATGSAYLVTEVVSPDGDTAAFLQVRDGDDGQEAGVQLLDIESGVMSPWRPTSHGKFGAKRSGSSPSKARSPASTCPTR